MAILNIILQHASQSAFLWLLRDMAVNAPHYSLKDLAKLDERLEAHLDGLRIAGDEGWEICRQELSLGEPGEVFAATVLAFESKKEDRIKEVIRAGTQSQELARAIISALGWIQYSNAREFIEQFHFEDNPVLRQIGIAASTVHRREIPEGALVSALNDGDIYLKASSLKALGELGKLNMQNYLHENFNSPISLICFTAARSAAILGNPNAPYILKSILKNLDKPYHEEAVKTACRKMNLTDSNHWVGELRENQVQLRLAVIAAGAAGDPVNIPWLIEMMNLHEISRIAGESFRMITGVDLAYEDMDRRPPEGFEAGPTENPEDENVGLDQDENLPMPDAKLVMNWWGANKSKYKNGNRYLCGQLIDKESMGHVLRTGMQIHRKAAVLELTRLMMGQPLFNVKSPGNMQKKLLAVK